MRYKEAFPGACVAQEGQVGPWTAEWLGGSGCSGDVQYLVGDGVGWALVCIVATEFDEDDGPGGDVDGGDAGDGGISDAARKSAVMSSMQWDGAVLVGRGTVLTVRLRAAE